MRLRACDDLRAACSYTAYVETNVAAFVCDSTSVIVTKRIALQILLPLTHEERQRDWTDLSPLGREIVLHARKSERESAANLPMGLAVQRVVLKELPKFLRLPKTQRVALQEPLAAPVPTPRVKLI